MKQLLNVPVTASWSTDLPQGLAPIGISRGSPRRRRGYRRYAPLAPGPWFKSVTAREFHRRYMAQLGKLDAAQVLADLNQLAAGAIPALLCFEREPPDTSWCHRGLVAGWFKDELSLDVAEYGHETEGAGWQHPKLPPFLRR